MWIASGTDNSIDSRIGCSVLASERNKKRDGKGEFLTLGQDGVLVPRRHLLDVLVACFTLLDASERLHTAKGRSTSVFPTNKSLTQVTHIEQLFFYSWRVLGPCTLRQSSNRSHQLANTQVSILIYGIANADEPVTQGAVP